MIFIVKFNDNTSFSGHSFNHDWNKMPDKKITQLDFIYGESHVQLRGYKEYHHLYERSWTNQSQSVSALFLMGREETSTTVIIYDFIGRKGYKALTKIGYEYPIKRFDKEGNFLQFDFEPRIITGWKEGILNRPACFINKLKRN